jgi:hypothetical protein
MAYRLDVKPCALKGLSDDEQIDIMRNWFYENYQNPEIECPYDHEEGDYVYIWGGPYSAEEELETEFGDYVKAENIKTLVNELEGYCYEWSAISSPEYPFNEEKSDSPTVYENAIERFNTDVTNMRLKSCQSHPHKLQNRLRLFKNRAVSVGSARTPLSGGQGGGNVRFGYGGEVLGVKGNCRRKPLFF